MIRVLLPDARRWPALDAPLSRVLGKADHDGPHANPWLAEMFGLPAAGQWPSAALTRLVDAPEAAEHNRRWLRADPAWIKADINGGKLLAVGETMPMSREDVDAFLPALAPFFQEAGIDFDAPNPHRWYLALDSVAELPEFHGPTEALGDEAFEHLNFSTAHRRWKTLMSEAQILLHQHPHNAVRAARGLPPVNSLWFWGQGRLPPQRRPALGNIHTRDAALAGLGTHHGLNVLKLRELPAQLEADALYDLRGIAPSDIAQRLPAWLGAAAIQLLFEDRAAMTVRRGQRHRIWRRPLQIRPST